MTDAWRLFIALELPPPILRTIANVQSDLRRTIPERAARWVRPEGIHLTLKFLGDVPVEKVDDLRVKLAKAAEGHHPFMLGIQGLGCFPNLRQPRVLWLGLVGEVQELAALQESVENHIAPLGFPTEERDFHPHLTLARTARDATRQEAAALGRAAEQGIGQHGAWQVAEVSLIRSQLRPEGALYTEVWNVHLEPSGD
jgi:2'-5' RNA ligase